MSFWMLWGREFMKRSLRTWSRRVWNLPTYLRTARKTSGVNMATLLGLWEALSHTHPDSGASGVAARAGGRPPARAVSAFGLDSDAARGERCPDLFQDGGIVDRGW